MQAADAGLLSSTVKMDGTYEGGEHAGTRGRGRRTKRSL